MPTLSSAAIRKTAAVPREGDMAADCAAYQLADKD